MIIALMASQSGAPHPFQLKVYHWMVIYRRDLYTAILSYEIPVVRSAMNETRLNHRFWTFMLLETSRA